MGRKLVSEEQKRETKRRKAEKWRFKNLYGITQEDYREMNEKQSGRCAICQTIPEKRLVVDHCHNTGRVRGLLCYDCNHGLGKFRDNVEFLLEAASYLQK
jgi:hypothetical protein